MTEMLIILGLLLVVVLFLVISQGTRTHEQIAPESMNVDWDATEDEAFQAALERGNKIEAIKIYREKTGLGLKESKDAVEFILAGGIPAKKRRSRPPVESAAGVRDLLEEGRKDEAIDLYAKFAGVDQYTARDAVEQIEREMRLGDEAKETEGLTASDRETIQQLLERGNKIEAIKIYHDKTGLGLKEAKDAIDEMARWLR